MKYEVTSNRTKKMLADSLRKFLLEKPFSKVTVSEIIRDCGVNRKTFYYHFEDINALVTWCFQEDFSSMVQQFTSVKDLKENLLLALDYVDGNPYILNCIHDSVGLVEFKKFFYNNYVPIINQHFVSIGKDFIEKMDTPYKDFIYPFWAYSIINLLLDYFNDLAPYREREALVNYIATTCDYMLEFAFPEIAQEMEESDIDGDRNA